VAAPSFPPLREIGVTSGRVFRSRTEARPLFAALEKSPNAVFVTDRHNRIVFWNRSAEGLLGYTSDEMVGSSCGVTLQGCDDHGNRYCGETCPITQIAARQEAIRRFGLRLTARDGHELFVDVNVLNLTIEAPESFLLVHILTPAAPAPSRTSEESAPPPRPPMEAVRESPDARVRRLTAREVEVLGMLAAGHSTPDIAARLYISNLTARNHIQNILDKLEVHSKAEAIAFAFQKRLL
jgi:PAS domain S-box-containing protein